VRAAPRGAGPGRGVRPAAATSWPGRGGRAAAAESGGRRAEGESEPVGSGPGEAALLSGPQAEASRPPERRRPWSWAGRAGAYRSGVTGTGGLSRGPASVIIRTLIVL
jgi:hypothetical protein